MRSLTVSTKSKAVPPAPPSGQTPPSKAVPTLVLHQFPKIDGAPSLSPFCVKVHFALALKGLAYETRDTINSGSVSPTGKLPALAIDDEIVCDSSVIFRRLDRLAPEPPLKPQAPAARALNHVLEDWADESLYGFVIYYRWAVDENVVRTTGALFASSPAPVRAVGPLVAKRQLRAKVRSLGLTKARAEIDDDFERHLGAIDALVGQSPFVTGEALAGADLAIAAQLQALRVGLTPDAARLIDQHEALRAWLGRVLGRCGARS
jgi:glutathione S-transferase